MIVKHMKPLGLGRVYTPEIMGRIPAIGAIPTPAPLEIGAGVIGLLALLIGSILPEGKGATVMLAIGASTLATVGYAYSKNIENVNS